MGSLKSRWISEISRGGNEIGCDLCSSSGSSFLFLLHSVSCSDLLLLLIFFCNFARKYILYVFIWWFITFFFFFQPGIYKNKRIISLEPFDNHCFEWRLGRLLEGSNSQNRVVIHRFQVYIRYPYAPWDWNLSLQYISAVHIGKNSSPIVIGSYGIHMTSWFFFWTGGLWPQSENKNLLDHSSMAESSTFFWPTIQKTE